MATTADGMLERRHPHRAAASSFPRIVGLDGLRAVAVIAVLGYHLWPAVLPGGYVGVTLFFALSGFLITSMLLHEQEQTGTIALGRFYSRRARRLLPASLAVLLAVGVGWGLTGWLTPDVRQDLIVSLGQVANWSRALAGQQYGVDGTSSPVLHYWSLGIEEQMYLVLPVVVLLCRRRAVAIAAIAVGLAGAAYAVGRAAGDASISYYSSFTRAGEILAGALLGALLAGSRRVGRAASICCWVVAGGGLVALGWVALRLHVTDPWVSGGALLVCGGVGAAVVAAVSRTPALGRWLDVRPLARIGELSYGIYLFHWPILQTLRHTTLPTVAVPWLTLVATFVVADASARWFERPIRVGALPGPRFAGVVACACLVLPVVALAMERRDRAQVDHEAAAAEFQNALAASALPVANVGSGDAASAAASAAATATSGPGNGPVSSTTAPSTVSTIVAVDAPGAPAQPAARVATPPLRVGFFGDSKAVSLGLGAANTHSTDYVLGASYAGLGCPVGRGGRVRSGGEIPVADVPAHCDWSTAIHDSAVTYGPLDAAIVWAGTWDISDRSIPALGGGWTSVDDPAYRLWLLGEMQALTDEIIDETGAKVVAWLTVPVDPTSSHPERFAMWTDLLAQLAASRPGQVTVIDVAAYVAASGQAAHLLPDGVHPTNGLDDPQDNTAGELMEWLLLPAIRETVG